jgi:hypothetical protein
MNEKYDSQKGLRLALTTIGDLLLNCKISRDATNQAMENIALKIPNYQRPYKWTPKNAMQLLDDILDAMSENKEVYRVGTLILHHTNEDANDVYNIVDGQQRTITFCLLLSALKNDTDVPFMSEGLSNDIHNRLNVKENFRAYERRINAIKDDREKEHLLKYITEQCELIVIITEDISEAFQFFDSQNSRGKKLYPHDLLKAYHLREMNDLNEAETEKVVKDWENMDQRQLASLLADYLYRVREWMNGNKAWELNEQNIYKFKGITRRDNSPYAQFYKSAYSYANMANHSAMPFVVGMRHLNPFQLGTPIIAGEPFFVYAKHYFDILKDIQNNDKYEGYFINDNIIVKTLDLKNNKNGVGNRITRLLFDVAALLYVDRFCCEKPSQTDLDLFDQFVTYDFIWAYSLRAQYYNLGWWSAQNYIMGPSYKGKVEVINSFNLYKVISEADSPISLLSELAERVKALPEKRICAEIDDIDEQDLGVYHNYLHFFKENHFYIVNK